VVVPDYFYGDPYDDDRVDRPLPIWMEDHEPVSTCLLMILF